MLPFIIFVELTIINSRVNREHWPHYMNWYCCLAHELQARFAAAALLDLKLFRICSVAALVSCGSSFSSVGQSVLL